MSRMAVFGALANVLAQLGGDAASIAVRRYLEAFLREDTDAWQRVRSVAVGETRRIELEHGAFALEQAYRAKPRSEGFFESHAKFIDVQVVLEGEEIMEVADLAHMTVAQPLDPSRDLIVYRDTASASQLRLRTGDAAVFFPADVHMPGLAGTSPPAVVRKTVVKVPVTGRTA